MFCQKCGKELGEEMQFCPACGTRVVKLEELSKPEVASQPEVASKPEQAPKPETPAEPDVPSKEANDNDLALQKEPELGSTEKEKKLDSFPGKTADAIENKNNAVTGVNKPLGKNVHPYHSLGGFPLFLVVVNYIAGIGGFISVIVTLFQYIGLFRIASYGGGAVTGFLVFSMLGGMGIGAASGIICLRFAIMLQRKDPGFLHTIQTGSLTLLIVSSIYYFIVLIWAKSFDVFGMISTGSYVTQWVFNALMWVASLVVMSVYFGRSVRVRTYMGSSEYLRRSLFNKNTISPIPADGSVEESVKTADVKPMQSTAAGMKTDSAMAVNPASAKEKEAENVQPEGNSESDLASGKTQNQVVFPEAIVNDWQENEETRPLKMKQEELVQSDQSGPEGTKVFEPAKHAAPSAERIVKVEMQPDPQAKSAFSQTTPVPAEQTTGHAFTSGLLQSPANSNAAQMPPSSPQTPDAGYAQMHQDASAYAANPDYSSYPGSAGYSQYPDYSEYAAYPGYSNYQEYAAYGEPDPQQGTTSIWKPLMLVGLIVGLVLVALAIVMVLMEAELGFILGLGIAGVAVIIFGIICLVKYVGSI